jgi:pimeloyl-ACP methyl ester carboxylesterase
VVYRDAFAAGGMRGPLNYYRNIDVNHAAMARYENAPVTVPALMVAADSDPVLPASLVPGMERWIEQLTVAHVTAAGHWVQQEQPEQVNRALVEFLASLG